MFLLKFLEEKLQILKHNINIISDSQIIPEENSPNFFYQIFSQNLKNTLEVLKSQNIQALIFAGDLTDSGTPYAYDTINKIFDEVYKEGEKRPIFNFIMGNHDYWLKYMVNNKFCPVPGDIRQMQFLFYTRYYFNHYPYIRHTKEYKSIFWGIYRALNKHRHYKAAFLFLTHCYSNKIVFKLKYEIIPNLLEKATNKDKFNIK